MPTFGLDDFKGAWKTFKKLVPEKHQSEIAKESLIKKEFDSDTRVFYSLDVNGKFQAGIIKLKQSKVFLVY
jgi:hypothetical protein